ncbi:sensor domain-containing protein [Rhodovulum sp. DZ06]|uniref:sensor domain-containing protein n=1 Tax=Rhodovulum sp. DZ06 TaxID=3425126 RepID=UPI003D350DB3
MEAEAEFFDLFLAGADLPALLCTPDGAILRANDAFAQALGRGPGWRPAGALDALSAPGGAEALRAACARAAAAPFPETRIACAFTLPDGTERFLPCTLRAALRDGRCAALLLRFGRAALLLPDGAAEAEAQAAAAPVPPRPARAARPVAGRRQADADAADHVRFLDLAGDVAGSGQYYFDVGSRQMRITSAFRRMLGWSVDDRWMPTSIYRERIHPEDLPALLSEIEALFAGRIGRLRVDHRLRRGDGGWTWVQNSAALFPAGAATGRPVICGAVSDISGRKTREAQLERALREASDARAAAEEAARLLSIATEHAGVVPWHLDPETGAMRWSAELERLLGLAPGALGGTIHGLRDHVHPEDFEAIRDMKRSLAEGRAQRLRLEYRLRRGDGTWRWFSTDLHARTRADGRRKILGCAVDVTEQRESRERAEQAAQEAEAARRRLFTLSDNAPVALLEYRMSPDGTFDLPYFNSWLPQMIGVSPEALAADGSLMMASVVPEDLPLLSGGLERSARTGTVNGLKFRVNHPEKGERHFVARATAAPQPDGGVIWYTAVVDITDQHLAQRRADEASEALDRLDSRLRIIAEVSPIGLYEFRKSAEGEATFPYLSPRAAELLGHGAGFDGAAAGDVLARIHPDDRPALLESVERSRRALTRWSERLRVQHPTRGALWIQGDSIPRPDPDGGVTWSGGLYDVTGDVQRQEELAEAHRRADAMRAENERQALHDGLTGLPNRRSYDRELSARIAAAQGGGAKDCVLVRVDLDHFKHVNDTLGHEAGDLVLQRVAEVLRAALGAGDYAARIGGDEFSLLLAPGRTPDDAAALVARIQARLAEPLMYRGRQCHFGASFGLARAEDLGETGVEIQIFADAALYRAKEGGRSRLELFTPELHRDILGDRKLAGEIHEALETDAFEPFFQPQVRARDGALHGAEALLRWRHPTRGLLAPGAFMHVAEQLRLAPVLDRRMMLRTRAVLGRWAEAGLVPPRISFNVSPGRMHDPDVVALARDMSGGPTKVVMELLESTLVEEEGEVFRFHLDQLREAGVEIEIDDFGSGHASIIGLMQLGPEALKIDQRLVAPVAAEKRARTLVRAIVDIAETLGIATVAEGVETEEQARLLRELGCDVLQGYLFSRPVDEAGFLRFAPAPRLKIA